MKRLSTYFILLSLNFVTFYGCNSSENSQSEEELKIAESLKEKFSNVEFLAYDGDTLLANNEVLSYYKSTEFDPVWIGKDSLNSQGGEMFALVRDARDHGLLPEMFHYNSLAKMKDSSLLDAEMILTNAFFLFTSHIDAGCLNPLDSSYIWKKDSLNYSLEEELDKVRNGENVTELIKSHAPQFWEYQQLQAGLSKFLDEFPLDTNRYEIPRFKDDSVKCYAATKIALIGHAFLDSTEMDNDSIFIERLKSFQRINGLLDDAIVGTYTGLALEQSNEDRFYRAALSLEKWRWKKNYPERYIRVNIPEYSLYFYHEDSLVRKHRVIVGATVTPTPEFHATMKTMITNPFWHVPYSISSTEILTAARKDTGYFSKKGYKIFKDGSQIDPTTVNWGEVSSNNFNYRVRQNGGGGNSLGRIKFMFPNVHSVFIHDTPTKYLFKNDVRSYSHGCIRLHEPFELAKAILTTEENKVKPDELDTLVKRGSQKAIEVNQEFEVFIEYITTIGDSTGNIVFYTDIYKRDERMINHTFKKFSF